MSLLAKKLIYGTSAQFDLDDIEKDLKGLKSDFLTIYSDLHASKARYNLLKGGRSSTKTNLGGAGWIILKSFDLTRKDSRLMCLREFATSIDSSTYSTIVKIIFKYKLEKYYLIRKTYLKNKHTNIIINFSGCQNALSLKGLDDASGAWFEEMEKLDYETIKVITDSIRWEGKSGAEAQMLYTFNPYLPIDDVKKYWDEQEDDDKFEKHLTIYDLPEKFVNKSMLRSAENDKKKNKSTWAWAWLGKPKATIAEYPFLNLTFKEKDDIRFKKSFLWIDPSFIGSDTTAVAVISPSIENKIDVVGYCFSSSWYDSINIINRIADKHNSRISYENNGVGYVPKQTFWERYQKDALGVHSSNNKVSKIANMSPFIGNMNCFIDKEFFYESVEFSKQVKNWCKRVTKNPKKDEYDDAPDALAALLENLGVIR